MLLLVLILVLVAFGLLVVALLTGNVLCAWLSVAVSVAAAVVLVVDWLQRRSALKAGATEAAAPPASTPESILLGEPDPVTEVLPVVHPFAEPVGAKATEDESRFDRPADGQQTIIMPAVQPSGSAARPSGAEGQTPSLGGSSSPSVTEKPREPALAEDSRSATDSRESDAEATVSVDIRKAGIDGRKPGASAVGAPGDGAQVAAGARAGASGLNTEKAVAPPSDAEPSGVGPDAERSGAGPDAERSGGGPAAAGGGAAVAAAATAAVSTPPTRPAAGAHERPAHERPAHERTDDDGPTSAAATASGRRPDVSDVSDDQTVVTAVNPGKGAERPDGRAAETATDTAAEARASDSRTQADPASAENAVGVGDSEQTISTSSTDAATAAPAAVESAAVDGAGSRGAAADQSPRATFGGPVSSGHELFDPVSRSADAASSPPPPSSGGVEDTAVMGAAAAPQQADDSEPPEEPFDPAVAPIVARLEDEVFVIDEQPRYHVASCRAVATHATIPLPAREAIELGFTPCGWCTPDAVLADRHRASAH